MGGGRQGNEEGSAGRRGARSSRRRAAPLGTRMWFQREQLSSVSVVFEMSATLKYECQPLKKGSGSPLLVIVLRTVVVTSKRPACKVYVMLTLSRNG